MNRNQFSLLAFFFMGTISSLYAVNKKKPSCPAKFLKQVSRLPLVLQADESGKFSGMTPSDWKTLLEAREGLNHRQAMLNERYLSGGEFLKVSDLMSIFGGNIILLGPGGGGKTGMVKALHDDNLWTIQLQELTPVEALIGGFTEAGFKAGSVELNTKGTMVEAEFVLIDESEAASPAVLAALFSFLSRDERLVYSQGKPILAENVRTAYLTGNATFVKLKELFEERGLSYKTQPYLRRTTVKFRVPHRISTANQLILNRRIAEKERLIAMGRANPNGLDSSLLLPIPKLQYYVLEQLATSGLFETSDEFDNGLVEFSNKMSRNLVEFANTAEIQRLDDPRQNINPFVATWDDSTATQISMARWVKVSLLFDILRSNIPDDYLKSYLSGKTPIVLGPSSLWRLHSLMTTVGPNLTYFDPYLKKIAFSATLDPNTSIPIPLNKDEEEKHLNLAERERLNHELAEQKLFADTFKSLLETWKEDFEDIAKLAPGLEIFQKTFNPEHILAKFGGTEVRRFEASSLPETPPIPQSQGTQKKR